MRNPFCSGVIQELASEDLDEKVPAASWVNNLKILEA